MQLSVLYFSARKRYCYEKMGEKELAYNQLMDLARMFRSDGYDEDALVYEQMADAIKQAVLIAKVL